MIGPGEVVALIAVAFLCINLVSNYDTFKENDNYLTIGAGVARKYKKKCWRDVVLILAIIAVLLWRMV